MKQVLVLYEQNNTTQLMLCSFLMDFQKVAQYEIKQKKTMQVKKNDIEQCDIIITIRSMSPLEEKITRIAKKMGKSCVSFWDDDFSAPRDDVFIHPKRRKSMINQLRLVDAIMSPNKYLARKLSKYGDRPMEWVLDTAVSLDRIPKTKEENKKLKIAYAAGKTHSKDFDEKILKAFVIANEKYPNSFELYFVGVEPEVNIERLKFPVKQIGVMSMTKYRKYMLNENFDLGLAPLHGNEFSKSKYYNKFIDYTLNNMVGIYSNCMPYTLIIEDGVNGFLADDDTDSWLKKLEYVITHRDVVKECLENSKAILEKKFSLDEIIRQFTEQINSLSNKKNNDSIRSVRLFIYKVQYVFFKYTYLPMSYIKNIGIKKTLNRATEYINSVKLSREG